MGIARSSLSSQTASDTVDTELGVSVIKRFDNIMSMLTLLYMQEPKYVTHGHMDTWPLRLGIVTMPSQQALCKEKIIYTEAFRASTSPRLLNNLIRVPKRTLRMSKQRRSRHAKLHENFMITLIQHG